MKKYFALLFLFPLLAHAQDEIIPNNNSFGINYLAGKIFVHTKKIHLQAPPYSKAFEFSYKRQTTGNKEWHQRFGFPEIGLNIAAASYGDSRIGYSLGFYPSIQFRILNFKQSFWYWKLGGGIGVATQSWSRLPYADTMKNYLGSRINNFTMIQTGFRQRLNNHWSMQAGLHFFHVSNAAARQPNYGINTYGAFVGINYHPNGFQNHFIKKELPRYKNPLNLGIKSMISFAEDKVVDGPMYPYYTFDVFSSKMYRNKNRVLVGAEATYSSKVFAFLKNNYIYPGKQRQHSWQYNLFVGHEFVFGKIGLPLQLGYYLNKPLGGDIVYQKLGMNYHFYHSDKHSILKDAFLITQLKTHFARAEYAEMGLGFMF